MPRDVPSLQALALQAVATAVHDYEPDSIYALPYGGGLAIIKNLIETGRLRPETLRPLLLSDWSSSAQLSETLGNSLVSAAPGCRGLEALAAQRLAFNSESARQRRKQQQLQRARHELLDACSALPSGTRKISVDVSDVDDLRISASR